MSTNVFHNKSQRFKNCHLMRNALENNYEKKKGS